MSLRIQNNVEALGAHRNLNATSDKIAKSMERLSSGYRINRALIEEMDLIPDCRAPDNIRLGIAPLYISFDDVYEAVNRICQVMEEKRYLHYPMQQLEVT